MKLISLIIPFTIALSAGCATKLEPCGDGMARADDGNCYPYEGIGDTGSTNQLPDADADDGADLDADADDPPADDPPADDPPADDPPADDPPADTDGDSDDPPSDDPPSDDPPSDDPPGDDPPGDDPPSDDPPDDLDEGPPADAGEPGDEGGPSGCTSDADCEGECFGEGTGCVCEDTIEICVPSCDTDDDCPGGMSCSGGVCDPGAEG